MLIHGLYMGLPQFFHVFQLRKPGHGDLECLLDTPEPGISRLGVDLGYPFKEAATERVARKIRS
jgi:hypothetical protein